MSFETSLVWIDPPFLAFGEKPGRWRPLDQDLDLLRSHRIGAILSLLDEDAATDVYRRSGFEVMHVPVRDFQAPTRSQIKTCVQLLSDLHQRDIPAYVHCYAGFGRSGTIAAAWLIHRGMPPLEAVTAVRRLKAGTIETESQLTSLLEFAARK